MTSVITTIMIVGTVTIAAVGVTVILLAAGALVYGVGRAVWRVANAEAQTRRVAT